MSEQAVNAINALAVDAAGKMMLRNFAAGGNGETRAFTKPKIEIRAVHEYTRAAREPPIFFTAVSAAMQTVYALAIIIISGGLSREQVPV